MKYLNGSIFLLKYAAAVSHPELVTLDDQSLQKNALISKSDPNLSSGSNGNEFYLSLSNPKRNMELSNRLQRES